MADEAKQERDEEWDDFVEWARAGLANPPERIMLSGRDALRVMELIENPPPPTEALLEAARRLRNNDARSNDECRLC